MINSSRKTVTLLILSLVIAGIIWLGLKLFGRKFEATEWMFALLGFVATILIGFEFHKRRKIRQWESMRGSALW